MKKAKIIAVINDLFFEAKVKAAADALFAPVLIIKEKELLMKELETMEIITTIFDLNFNKFDPVEAAGEIKQKYNIKIIGYLSHIQQDLRKSAEKSFDIILSRSEFSNRLSELLMV